jgi:catechol 2,3-dioxygenase-like lactoylglutathione lyase family enzyme
MPEVRAFSHVAFTVTNLEASAVWYERLLGAVRATMGSEHGTRMRCLWLRVGSSSDSTTTPLPKTTTSSAKREWDSTTLRLSLPIGQS